MSDDHPPYWHGPRRRPPWWPEGEPWPPSAPPGAEAWRQFSRRFVRRMIGLVLALFILTVGGWTLAFWLTVTALGTVDLPRGLVPAACVISLTALLLVLITARSVRRITAPVDDLMGAVERVAEGDFEVRVPERGPRELRRLGRALNGMAARLKAAEAQRRSLLADVTHELRTPLTVIQGNLEGLLDGVYPADAAHLAPILDETRVLSRLIEDLRTLSLAESGALALHREPTLLGVLCAEAAAGFRAQAEAAGVSLTVDVVDDLPPLNADPVRLREMLSNLLANALQYTPAGGQVALSAKPPARAEAPGAAPAAAGVVLEVADTGPGISADALPHVFDRFYKSADSRGSGLGLAIAKSLVEAHGGKISAASQAGVGTRVTVELGSQEAPTAPTGSIR